MPDQPANRGRSPERLRLSGALSLKRGYIGAVALCVLTRCLREELKLLGMCVYGTLSPAMEAQG